VRFSANLANALPKPEIGFYWEVDNNTMWFVRPARNGGNPYANTKAPLDARWNYQRGGMVTLANRIHNGQAVSLTLAQDERPRSPVRALRHVWRTPERPRVS